ncbi:hypothetical protein NESM_000096100 [Novymonas esmeraldas]|uniref:Uncharacterized protein n=1 Tax=Novymonas esmeraldas TaxID=1808958 RepID=A0AAW0F5J2_9TRYP
MSSTPVSPSKQSSAAAAAPATSGDAAEAVTAAVGYSSSIVQLPPTVPELIVCLEQQHKRCVQLAGSLERVRAEAARLSAGSVGTSAEGRYTALASLAAADGGSIMAGGSPGGARTTTAPPSPSPPTRPSGGVVRGAVLTGTVVSATAAAAPASSAPVRATAVVATAQPPSRAPSTATTTSTAAAAMEEVAELRVRAAALEATQRLLTDAREELSAVRTARAAEQSRLEAALADAAELRQAITAGAAATSSPSQECGDVAPAGAATLELRLSQLQSRCAESEAHARAAQRQSESTTYAQTRLQERVAALTQEKAFLEEKNTHLEGQLQRLLMSAMETAAPRHTASGGGGGGGSSSGGATSTAAPRLTASEAYQKEALEKQIGDLRTMTDKLNRDAQRQAARRVRAEEVAQGLQKENAELKAAALQYRRQVNESELELERAITRKEEDERLRQLERDANRLRSALRDLTDHHEREKMSWEVQQLQWTRRARVHEAAEKQLLKRLVSYQVREAVWQQCRHGAAQRGRAPVAAAAASAPSGCTANGARKSAAASATAATAAPAPAAARGGQAAPPPSAAAAGPVVLGAAADAATLVDRERQLEELRHTFDRRVALVEAQRTVEAQQLLALNKELRQALSVSQEELMQKTRLLEAVQRRPPPLAAAVVPLTPSLATPATLSHGSSVSGGWRDTATALVCRGEGGEEGPAASADDVGDIDAFASAHTPMAAVPRLVTEIERRYDPERMSTWEAVQVENEALLDRLTTMQEEKWRLTSMIEDLQRQCGALKGELRRNASTMNQLLAAGVLTPAAVSRGGDEGRLRALQCMLQETLQAKFELEERLQEATQQRR